MRQLACKTFAIMLCFTPSWLLAAAGRLTLRTHGRCWDRALCHLWILLIVDLAVALLMSVGGCLCHAAAASAPPVSDASRMKPRQSYRIFVTLRNSNVSCYMFTVM